MINSKKEARRGNQDLRRHQITEPEALHYAFLLVAAVQVSQDCHCGTFVILPLMLPSQEVPTASDAFVTATSSFFSRNPADDASTL